jgi:hypothetical protein
MLEYGVLKNTLALSTLAEGYAMKHLFNSKGLHIATEDNWRLYTPKGANIGHFVSDYGIYINQKGRYIGEVMYENRFFFNRLSPFRSTAFGMWGNYGALTIFGSPRKVGRIGLPSGYEDIEL